MPYPAPKRLFTILAFLPAGGYTEKEQDSFSGGSAMSVMFGILVVLGIALLMFLNIVKQKATTDLYQKMHPPKKEQEEFLKACELYLEYRKDPETHPEPARDAKRDAAMAVENEGFLPAALEHLGYPKDPKKRAVLLAADKEPTHITYQSIETVSRAAFLACREEDRGLAGYSQDKRFWNDSTFSNDAWNRYIAEMDAAFNQMVDRYLSEVADTTAEFGPHID